jgi:hypothetical protein
LPTPSNNSTIFEYLEKQSFPQYVRLPSIQYGGGFQYQNYTHKDIIDASMLSTIGNVHHEGRTGEASKAMIDVSRATMNELVEDHARTIHNPNRKICGENGRWDFGADYIASIFRLNHYVGTFESYMERSTDFRGWSMDKYLSTAA